MSTIAMDYVRDFLEDVKHDRALQLKTFITVVLSITGFSLFCVEDARLHRANDVVHFTQGETSPTLSFRASFLLPRVSPLVAFVPCGL